MSRAPLTYCSFATEAGCLGVLVLDGELTPRQASAAAWLLGQNPGGELLAIPVPSDVSEAHYAILLANRGRLITTEEAARLFGAKRVAEHFAN